MALAGDALGLLAPGRCGRRCRTRRSVAARWCGRLMIGVMASALVPGADRRAHARARDHAPARGPASAPAAGRRRDGLLPDADQPARAGDPARRSPSRACPLLNGKALASIAMRSPCRSRSCLIVVFGPRLLALGQRSRWARLRRVAADAIERAAARSPARDWTCSPARATESTRSASSCWPGRCSGWPATWSCSSLGLQSQATLVTAAAVLLAVNVSAVLPATPSNVGVFQAACLVVLAAYGVGAGRGPRLRDHPAGGRGHDRAGPGRAGAARRGAALAGHPRSATSASERSAGLPSRIAADERRRGPAWPRRASADERAQ